MKNSLQGQQWLVHCMCFHTKHDWLVTIDGYGGCICHFALIKTKQVLEKLEEVQFGNMKWIFAVYRKHMFTLSDTLKRGGNAADAAVAMAAALAVTEPCSTGPGGDAFCLFYSGNSGEIRGINGRLELLCLSECARHFHDPAQCPEPPPLCPQWSLGPRSDSWLYGGTWLHGWGTTFTFSRLKRYRARSPGMLVWYCSGVWQPEGLTFLKVLTIEVFDLDKERFYSPVS